MKVQIISLSTDVYLSCVRLVLRLETTVGVSEDFMYFKPCDPVKRLNAEELQLWVEFCKEESMECFFGICQDCGGEVANPWDEAAKECENVPPAPVAEVVPPAPVAEVEVVPAPTPAPRTRAKRPTPAPVEVVAISNITPGIEVTTKVVEEIKPVDAAPVASSTQPIEVAAASIPEAKPELIIFNSLDKEMVTSLYAIIDGLHKGWRTDKPFIGKLKPLLKELDGMHFKASKDSTTILRTFTLRLHELVELAKK